MKNEKLLKMISEADEENISSMIKAIIRRQKQLYPEWEPVYLSFPLNRPEECRMIMDTTWKMLTGTMEDLS